MQHKFQDSVLGVLAASGLVWLLNITYTIVFAVIGFVTGPAPQLAGLVFVGTAITLVLGIVIHRKFSMNFHMRWSYLITLVVLLVLQVLMYGLMMADFTIIMPA